MVNINCDRQIGNKLNTERIIQNITEIIQSASSNEELVSKISEFCKNKGVENFIFGASLFNNLKATPQIHILDNSPGPWRDRYESKGYFNEDFRVAHCKSMNSPIIWPVKNKRLTGTNKKIISEAEEFGIKSGISFPFHGAGCEFGMFSASTSEKFHKSTLNNPFVQYEVQLLGCALFDYLTSREKKKNTKSLTKREKECLQWIAMGKTSWETSVILDISERTVIFHIQNATSKMNAASRTSAAVIALMNGAI